MKYMIVGDYETCKSRPIYFFGCDLTRANQTLWRMYSCPTKIDSYNMKGGQTFRIIPYDEGRK